MRLASHSHSRFGKAGNAVGGLFPHPARGADRLPEPRQSVSAPMQGIHADACGRIRSCGVLLCRSVTAYSKLREGGIPGSSVSPGIG